MSDKIAYEKAPVKGLLLAYFRDGIVFEKYSLVNKNLKADSFKNHNISDLLELHMFNHDKEFRAILSRTRENKFIPNDIISSEEEDYIDEIVLINSDVADKLLVRSYLSYDKYGMIKIENFQLMIPEDEKDE